MILSPERGFAEVPGGVSLGLFRSKASSEKSFTRVFFTTDVHGSEPAFLKFLGAASHDSANVLVPGGDITGKMMISVIEQPGGWHAYLLGKRVTADTQVEVSEMEIVIRTNGFYPYRTTPEEVGELEHDPIWFAGLFTQLMRQPVGRWLEMAEDRLAGSGVRVYISLGNDDRDDLIPVLEGSKVEGFPDGKVVPLDDSHEMASVGYGNMTPWKYLRDLPEEDGCEDRRCPVAGSAHGKLRVQFPRTALRHCPGSGA